MSFDGWSRAAHARYKDLEIRLEKLLRGHDLVRAAVGESWFEDQARKIDQGVYTIADAHPLYREMTSSAPTALVEVCELGEYLEAFKNDPALPGMLADLRSEKYPSTLFELAMAYRFQGSGAGVRLQPGTPKGNVADFAATIGGLEFTVEVSVSPGDFFKQPRFRASMVAARTVEAVVDGVFPVAVRLTFHSMPDGNWEAMLGADLKRLCLSLREKAAKSEPIKDVVTATHWTIEGEAVTEMTEPTPERGKLVRDAAERRANRDWDVCFRSSRRPRKEGEPIEEVLGKDRPEVEVARVFAKFPPDTTDPYSVITRKTEKEARQLRGVSGPRIVMLDISAVEGDVLSLGKDQVLASLAGSMRRTPELAAVWLMSRRFSTALRFQYHIIYVMNGDSVYQIPASFIDKLVEFVWLNDFLGERQIVLTSEDEALRNYWRRMRDDLEGRTNPFAQSLRRLPPRSYPWLFARVPGRGSSNPRSRTRSRFGGDPPSRGG